MDGIHYTIKWRKKINKKIKKFFIEHIFCTDYIWGGLSVLIQGVEYRLIDN